jgi:multisubunit Na+/H+ antiporter MnhG subunit
VNLVTVALLIAAAWLLGAVALVAVCRAAARGDRALRSSRWYDTHEYRLSA